MASDDCENCGDPKAQHHRGKAQCKALGCECLKYIAPGGNPRPAGGQGKKGKGR